MEHAWTGDEAIRFEAELLAERTDGARTTEVFRTPGDTYVIVGSYLNGDGWISIQSKPEGVVRNLSNRDRATGDRFLTPHVRNVLVGAAVNDPALSEALEDFLA